MILIKGDYQMKPSTMKKLFIIFLSAVIVVISGCSQRRDYGTQFNPETDCQYSYYGSVTSWNKIQSDSGGHYLLHNDYIYYYSNHTGKLTPLCNKPNCLHDMETDSERKQECNAYAPMENNSDDLHIQYYDGYIYYFLTDNQSSHLYRVSKDGQKRDKIMTVDDTLRVNSWLIHRGWLYYSVQSSFYGEKYDTQIYTKFMLKALEISSHMNEKNGEVIYETGEKYNAVSLNKIKAYKNYVCYSVLAAPKSFDETDTAAWMRSVYAPVFIYNTDNKQNCEIPVPTGNGNYTTVGDVTFLQDRLLVKLYNNLSDVEGDTLNGLNKVPIYSMNYDLTDVKVWLDGVEQGKLMQSSGDYVIISDAFLQLLPDIYSVIVSGSDLTLDDILKQKTNVDIYSADGKRISRFVYPMNNKGNFNGFGPDGVNVEFQDNDNGTWSIYELNLNDVLHCQGEEVRLTRVSTR